MLKRHLLLALVCLATLFSQLSAFAGEMTLYSHENFRGREVTLRELTPNLTDIGFNDRASSLIVRSGTWELCVHADFGGQCLVFEKGEYPTLSNFNNAISSARELGIRHNGGEGSGRRGSLELFAHTGLNGNSIRMARDTPNFVDIGFNDIGKSMRIDEGNWQLCIDINYGGFCRVFGPGRYSDLGPELTGQVSSARLVDVAPARPVTPQYNAGIVFYEGNNMRGRAINLQNDGPNFVDLGFNDLAQSMIIYTGNWEVCIDVNYQGGCRVFGPGQYPVLDYNMNRAISSARLVRPVRQVGVELFSATGFRGDHVQFDRNVSNLTDYSFNDRTNSIIVYQGEWEFCIHSEFHGKCVIYGPGRYDSLGWFGNQISSLRKLR